MTLKKWDIVTKLKVKSEKLKVDDVVKTLLGNRGLTTKKEIEEFLNPDLNNVTINNVAIGEKQLKRAIERIQKAIDNKEQIIVYGDYDVDGICGAAILWETLHGIGAKVLPYIPHRIDEGYGLSETGIKNILSAKVDPSSRINLNQVKLIITVDNGIVANDAVDFANEQGIDVIITDHHVPSKKLPKALAIVHTTKLCGAGVGYILSRVILNSVQDLNSDRNEMPKPVRHDKKGDDHLELVALATIADLVPLLGANRTLTKFGLEKLRATKRVGLLALFKEAGIDRSMLGTYEVGHLIAPRLNAMGRLESAMDSLRLLCTKNRDRATLLAHKLESTNKERQLVTEETILHAKSVVSASAASAQAVSKLIFISHETYQQGVIGLVAGKLVEEFYRPAIVISKGEKISRASARSVHGFNIIEFIRSASEFLVDAGGHPMAAGFTVETEKLVILQTMLEERAEKEINEGHLTRLLRIDCEIDFSVVTDEFYKKLEQFEPFGMGDPQPTFVTRNVVVEEMRLVGQEGKHVRFRLSQEGKWFTVIAFGFGKRAGEFQVGNTFDIAYTVDEDRWLAPRSLGGVGNGRSKLQLKLKDLRKS